MSDTANRPTEVEEIIRNVRSGVDYGSMGTIRALLDYVRSLEAERDDLELELNRTLNELIAADNQAHDPQSAGLYEECLRATENRLRGLLEREAAQQGGEADHGA